MRLICQVGLKKNACFQITTNQLITPSVAAMLYVFDTITVLFPKCADDFKGLQRGKGKAVNDHFHVLTIYTKSM